MTMAEKQIARAKRAAAPKPISIEEAIAKSSHKVERKGARYRCTQCKQDCGVKVAKRLREWLQTQCPAAEMAAARRAGVLVVAGVRSHESHNVTWSRGKKKHFCWNCGALTAAEARRLATRLRNPCLGPPKGRVLMNQLRSMRNNSD